MTATRETDAVLRRLTACHLSRPDPAAWLAAADRCEELGRDEEARLWRRRAEWFAGLRDLIEYAARGTCGQSFRGRFGAYLVQTSRAAATVRVDGDDEVTAATGSALFSRRVLVRPLESASGRKLNEEAFALASRLARLEQKQPGRTRRP